MSGGAFGGIGGGSGALLPPIGNGGGGGAILGIGGGSGMVPSYHGAITLTIAKIGGLLHVK